MPFPSTRSSRLAYSDDVIPAKAGAQDLPRQRRDGLRSTFWVPAFAGITAGLTAAGLAIAQQSSAPTTSPDPALEARVKALSAELRCLVCQNQTVADSDAPVARDMRDQVRTQLAAGKTETEIKQYMTDRFGDFVLYKPPLKAATVVLWAGPFVALLLAAVLLARRVRSRASSQPAGGATLTDAERERARALLNSDSRS